MLDLQFGENFGVYFKGCLFSQTWKKKKGSEGRFCAQGSRISQGGWGGDGEMLIWLLIPDICSGFIIPSKEMDLTES